MRYLLAVLLFLSYPLMACTGLRLAAKDGSQVNGRTLEFGILVDLSMVVVPRGYSFTGTTNQGPGMAYQTKYGAVGAIAFDRMAVLDGLNEKGLAVGTFYFSTFAEYATINSENQSKALSPLEFPQWLLTQFANVEEVKAGLKDVVIAPVISKEWGSSPPPFHYIVYDKEGNSLVIEPLKGKLVTHDNKIGTFTNSPDFDWHMTNLRNYINLSLYNAKPLTIDNVTLEPISQGTGLLGLPGDFSSPSRFVRAAVFTAGAIPSANAQETAYQIFHILNQFDIPIGAAREKGPDGVVHSDYTQATTVKDPSSLKYYFKTYDNQSISFIDLNQFDLNANVIKKAGVSGKQDSQNVSSQISIR